MNARRVVQFVAAASLAAALLMPAPAGAVTDVTAGTNASTDTIAGWTWSGMTPYGVSAGADDAPHVGGPGSYGVYTFHGNGIQVYGMKCADVTVDGKSHKVGRVKISIDGKEQSTINLAATSANPNAKIIGISTLTDGNHVLQVDPVDGWVVINSAKVVNIPLSPVAADHLVAYFDFDALSGTTLLDRTKNGHVGYFQAGAAWSRGAKAGKGALSFPAPGGVEVEETLVDTTASFTVSAWVKLSNILGYQTFVSIDGPSNSAFYLQLRDDTHQFSMTMPDVASSGMTPEPDVWYHLVGAYDATSGVGAIFVDGQLMGTKKMTPQPRAQGHTAIGRGKYDGKFVDFASGEIDEVRFFNVALLPDQVQALYESGR